MLRQREISELIIEQAVDAIILVGPDAEIVYQNAEARRLFGYPDEEVLGHTINQILHYRYPDGSNVPADHCKVHRAVHCGEVTRDFIWALYRKDGGTVYAACTAWPLTADGVQRGAVFFARDITDRKNAEESARLSGEILQMATDVAGIGIYDYNAQTDVLNWNDILKQHFGLPPDTPVSIDTFFAGMHPDDRQRLWDEFQRTNDPASGGMLKYEYRSIGLMDGKERWLSVRGKVLYENGHAKRRIGAIVDITERKLTEERLQKAAHHDPLTGLPNRALLAEYAAHILAMAVRDRTECAVLFIDLDRFKPINDLYGHDAGDKVLQEVANRLRSCTRKEDVVSRLGGDEFLVMLPHIDSLVDPQTVAQHIIERIGRPILLGHQHVAVSPSIGISSYPRHGKDIETLIRCADLAMYSAKKNGRNTVQVYVPGHDEQATERLQLEKQVADAIESNRMTLLYQPIIDLSTGQVVGLEALIRLRGADGSLVPPNKFISIVEEVGLINKLGKWVTDEACRQQRVWHAAGLQDVAVAINISPLEFRHGGFAEYLKSAIAQHELEPGRLQVEVTESAVMENVEEAIDTLNALRGLGVRIALDDFGTGYSSLSKLSNLPLDKLKIDQTFVSKLESNRSSQNVTDTIISLGRSMNLEVIGEGIESQYALDYLRDHGCNQAQGFFFSKPLSPIEFEDWYRKRPLTVH